MASAKRARYELLGIAALLFTVSIMLSIIAGIKPGIAVLQNIFGSLEIGYTLVSFGAAENALMIIAAFINVIVFALITVVFASMFFSFITRINIRERRALIKMRRLRHHIIVVPSNSFSVEMAGELKARGKEIVVMANSHQDFEHLYHKGFIPIIGDPKNIDMFNAANIRNADHVIVCDDNDINNTLITMTAKTASPHVQIISRVSNEANIPKLGMAGASRMIMPEITAGEQIGEELVKRVFNF